MVEEPLKLLLRCIVKNDLAASAALFDPHRCLPGNFELPGGRDHIGVNPVRHTFLSLEQGPHPPFNLAHRPAFCDCLLGHNLLFFGR